MFDTVAMIIVIAIVIIGIIWAVWFENFSGEDKKTQDAQTKENET